MKKKTLILNSAMGIASQVVTILFTFLTRTLFIKYIGVELLGINSTFTSVLGTLSLAELGFESAIVYSLYKPLHDGDRETVNDIMNIFRLVYRGVGIFFVVASVAVLPFLHLILKDVAVTKDVYLFFLLQAASSACTYFLAYKRALLYADRKDYITKGLDMGMNIVFNLVQCGVIIVTHNYVLYLVLKILQTYGANFIVHGYCKRAYPYLVKKTVNKQMLREIFGNVKNVFAARLGAYVYQATDNLVISAFVGTVSVGYFTNYSTVTKSLKTLTMSMLGPVMPFIGNFLVDEQTPQGRQKAFLLYTHVRYLVAAFVIIPLMVLVDDFIVMWVGEDMKMARFIPLLLAAEYYIDLVHSATVDFIDASGLFRQSRNITIAGALTNLISSLIFVQIWGIPGVLVGTILSQLVFWAGRSVIAYFSCMKCSAREFALYWLRNAAYLAVFLTGLGLCSWLYRSISISSLPVKFVAGGVMCEAVMLLLVGPAFMGLKEQKQLLNIVKSKLMARRSSDHTHKGGDET